MVEAPTWRDKRRMIRVRYLLPGPAPLSTDDPAVSSRPVLALASGLVPQSSANPLAALESSVISSSAVTPGPCRECSQCSPVTG